MKALLIMDMQHDFMPWGAFPVFGADRIIPTILQLAKTFSHIYASQEWHGNDHISFASNHGKKPGEEIPTSHGVQKLTPVHCVQGSLGACLVNGIIDLPMKKTFHKGKKWNVDSCSIFFDKQGEIASAIHEELQQEKVEDLYFVGVSGEAAVQESLLDALSLSYRCYFVQDACAFRLENAYMRQRHLRKMQEKGAVMLFSSQIS